MFLPYYILKKRNFLQLDFFLQNGWIPCVVPPCQAHQSVALSFLGLDTWTEHGWVHSSGGRRRGPIASKPIPGETERSGVHPYWKEKDKASTNTLSVAVSMSWAYQKLHLEKSRMLSLNFFLLMFGTQQPIPSPFPTDFLREMSCCNGCKKWAFSV